MQFKVSVVFPDIPVESYRQERDIYFLLVEPFAGHVYDVMVWSHKGKSAELVWFTSEHPQLHQLLHDALLTHSIWEYNITIDETKHPEALETAPAERVAVLPNYEMRALIAVLKMSASHFGRHICDDIAFESLVPDLVQRREMRKRFHKWNGDPEVFEEDQAAGGWYSEYHVWSYGAMLDYLAYRLWPELEKELREAGIRE